MSETDEIDETRQAIIDGNLEVIKKLHAKDTMSTELLWCCIYNKLDILKYLYSIGGKCMAFDMGRAIRNGNLEIAKFLEEKKVKCREGDIDASILKGKILAITTNNTELLDYIHIKHSKLSKDDLFFAIKEKNVLMVKHIHLSGVKIFKDTMEYAIIIGHLETVKYIHSIGIKFTNDNMSNAIYRSHLDILEYMYLTDIHNFTDDHIMYARRYAGKTTRDYIDKNKSLLIVLFDGTVLNRKKYKKYIIRRYGKKSLSDHYIYNKYIRINGIYMVSITAYYSTLGIDDINRSNEEFIVEPSGIIYNIEACNQLIKTTENIDDSESE